MKQIVTNVMQWLWNNQYLMMTPDELAELTDEYFNSCRGENGLLRNISNSACEHEFKQYPHPDRHLKLYKCIKCDFVKQTDC